MRGYQNCDTTFTCGLAPESAVPMLQCCIVAYLCALNDLLKSNNKTKQCVDSWND